MSHQENVARHRINESDSVFVKIAKLRDYLSDQASLHPRDSIDRYHRSHLSHILSDVLPDVDKSEPTITGDRSVMNSFIIYLYDTKNMITDEEFQYITQILNLL